ncbi:MAG TPA: heterodisulfide reductase-related iron-sulfur binding cluster [Syntrophomonas sp.]|nr:heterodisulfide reductase-related iron-sulfur binding cluster [Syntrophomonas sp.]
MIFGFIPMEGGYRIPMRVVGANIYFEWLIYILMLIPLGFFFYGFYQRVKVWRLAQGIEHRNDQLGKRIVSWLVNSLGQLQLLRKPLPGWMHFMLFWGFVFLLIATAAFASWSKTGFPNMTGWLYTLISWLADVGGFFAMIGVVVLFGIRYWRKPDRLNDTKSSDGWMLVLIFVVLLGGFVEEGLRLAAQMQLSSLPGQLDYERVASPAGWMFASWFTGMELKDMLFWHRVNWWVHMTLAFLFIALVPYSKLWHIFAGMIGHFSRDLKPSAIRMVDNIEEAERFGVENIEEFTWKDLLDLDACIRCGRCQENCPAYYTGKTLNPKITLIQAMKKHLDGKVPSLLIQHPAGDEVAMTSAAEVEAIDPAQASLIYDVVTPDVLWACTNCRACMEHCPMFIEHLNKITDMRRNLVMWQGDMPGEAQSAFTNMERNYNPWGVGWASRANWMEERGVRNKINLLPEDGRDFEYLLFAGCAVAFDDRYKKVGEALVKLLERAEVSFACLGAEEWCCGDSARRLGNEYLYQSLARHNIETFNRYGVKKIICICPHGYNCIKNEYPQMDGVYEVYHSSEILAKLIAEGRLQPRDTAGSRVGYHDSCFLGRHNGIYEEPRRVLRAAGAEVVEIDKSRRFGFCCGAGGGRMWLEETAVDGFKRINQSRTEQLLQTDPQIIACNCPFCLTMLGDGVKDAGREEQVQVMDICEILWHSV